MGIPGYFVDLLRNNRQVLVNARDAHGADVVCVDANSAIYEAVRDIEKAEQVTQGGPEAPPVLLRDAAPERAAAIIAPKVVATLAHLPALVRANDTLVVAFDGVAPCAKIAQQKKRRLGRVVLDAAMQEVSGEVGGFDTTAITPGTPFMTALMPLVESQLRERCRIPVMFSSSGDPGEGEHKLMDWIRSGRWSDRHVVVHGLDADLILLALANGHHCLSLRLAREAPSFVRSIDDTLSPLDTYIVDIPELAEVMGRAMGGGPDRARTDYVFLMSMLGNDFMPHQPAIGIRDGGIERLCAAYKAVRSARGMDWGVLRDGVPHWPAVLELVQKLGAREDKVMAALAKRRKGFATRATIPNTLPKDRGELEPIWNALPSLQIGRENWIDAGSQGWRGRYYQEALGEVVADPASPDSPWLRRWSESWLQGLQWVWEYYTSEVPSWRWTYQGTHPPPLLQDIGRLGSPGPADKLADWRGPSEPLTGQEQLALVLPPKKSDGTWDPPAVAFDWLYCRHAWEAELVSV